MFTVRAMTSDEMSRDLTATVRELCDRAFEDGGGFGDDDWAHALGGVHAVAFSGPEVIAHAAVVPRELRVDGTPHRVGYVEAVVTEPALQGQGIGSLVMAEIATQVESGFEFGALSTGAHEFYERLGWERWRGPTYVRTGVDLVRTSEEDDGIMVLRLDRSVNLDLTAAISCAERPGDDW